MRLNIVLQGTNRCSFAIPSLRCFLRQIDNPLLRIQYSNAPGVLFNLLEPADIRQQRTQRVRQFFPRQFGISNHDRGMLVHHRLCVSRLVIVGSVGEWNQDRRPARSLDFRDCCGSGAGNDQVGGGVILMELVEERADGRFEFVAST